MHICTHELTILHEKLIAACRRTQMSTPHASHRIPLTHDMRIQIPCNRLVHSPGDFRHNRGGDLWRRVGPNAGLKTRSISYLFTLMSARKLILHLVVDHLLMLVVFFQQREELDDVRVL